jgi:hypothetical protein
MMKSEILAVNHLVIKKRWEEIERLHSKLEKVVAKKGLQSLEAKWASKALDYKIYEYYNLKTKLLRWLSFKLDKN